MPAPSIEGEATLWFDRIAGIAGGDDQEKVLATFKNAGEPSFNPPPISKAK